MQHLPSFLHNGSISAVAGTTSLAEKHVEIVPMMVSLFEALRAERHARGDTTGTAPVGHEIRRPN